MPAIEQSLDTGISLDQTSTCGGLSSSGMSQTGEYRRDRRFNKSWYVWKYGESSKVQQQVLGPIDLVDRLQGKIKKNKNQRSDQRQTNDRLMKFVTVWRPTVGGTCCNLHHSFAWLNKCRIILTARKVKPEQTILRLLTIHLRSASPC